MILGVIQAEAQHENIAFQKDIDPGFVVLAVNRNAREFRLALGTGRRLAIFANFVRQVASNFFHVSDILPVAEKYAFCVREVTMQMPDTLLRTCSAPEQAVSRFWCCILILPYSS